MTARLRQVDLDTPGILENEDWHKTVENLLRVGLCWDPEMLDGPGRTSVMEAMAALSSRVAVSEHAGGAWVRNELQSL